MLRIKLFDGVEKQLKMYNGQAVLDYDIEFFIEECDEDLEYEEEDFTFPAYASAYLRIYNERSGRLLKNITTISQSGGSLILNASAEDMTLEDKGKYYYELGYVQTGGYDIVLAYGPYKAI